MKLSHTTSIADVMTPAPITASTNDPLSEAKKKMFAKEIRHLPVLFPDGGVAGVLTDRDLKLAECVGKDFGQGDSLKIEDACTLEPYVVSPETSLKSVLETMVERRIGSALVVQHVEIKGIFTLMDAATLLIGTIDAI